MVVQDRQAILSNNDQIILILECFLYREKYKYFEGLCKMEKLGKLGKLFGKYGTYIIGMNDELGMTGYYILDIWDGISHVWLSRRVYKKKKLICIYSTWHDYVNYD